MPGSKSQIVRLDERHHHAVGIGGGEIHRARRRGTRHRRARRGLDRSRRRETRVARSRATSRPPFHRRRIGDVGDRRPRTRASSLRPAGEGRRRNQGRRDRVDVLQNAEGDQRGEPLTVRRHLVNDVAAIRSRRSVPPSRADARRDRLPSSRAASPSPNVDDPLREIAAVERFAARLPDRFERARLIRKAKPVAGGRGTPSRQERLREPGLPRQACHLALPDAGDHRSDRKSVARVFDGRTTERVERQRAEAARERRPRGDGSGNGDRRPAFGRASSRGRQSVSGVQDVGERPDPLSPCKRAPSHTSANASPPMPFITGSTTVRVMAAATAASTAFPP